MWMHIAALAQPCTFMTRGGAFVDMQKGWKVFARDAEAGVIQYGMVFDVRDGVFDARDGFLTRGRSVHGLNKLRIKQAEFQGRMVSPSLPIH